MPKNGPQPKKNEQAENSLPTTVISKSAGIVIAATRPSATQGSKAGKAQLKR